MTTNVNLKGNIVIGTTNPITIPVNTPLPPATAGDLVFTYTLKEGDPPTNILNVGDFLTWAANMLSVSPDIAKDLPASLTALSLGVSNLLIDTSGKFDIGVLFGSMKDQKWNPSWQPIGALPFSFNNLELDVAYQSS